MLVVGFVILLLFLLWDTRYATRPVIGPRFLRNRSFIFASLIGFMDFVRISVHYIECDLFNVLSPCRYLSTSLSRISIPLY